jgi:hypothetical protein
VRNPLLSSARNLARELPDGYDAPRLVTLDVGPLLRAAELPPQKPGEKMKTLKVICASTLLLLVFSIPAFGDTAPGDNHTPGSPTKTYTTSTGTPTMTWDEGSLVAQDSEVAGDITLVLLADMFWNMTSVF